MDLPGSDWGDFSCRRAVDSSSCVQQSAIMMSLGRPEEECNFVHRQ